MKFESEVILIICGRDTKFVKEMQKDPHSFIYYPCFWSCMISDRKPAAVFSLQHDSHIKQNNFGWHNTDASKWLFIGVRGMECYPWYAPWCLT